jgi:hypothetical protein
MITPHRANGKAFLAAARDGKTRKNAALPLTNSSVAP